MESKSKRGSRETENNLPNTIVIQLVSPQPETVPISVRAMPLLPGSKATLEHPRRPSGGAPNRVKSPISPRPPRLQSTLSPPLRRRAPADESRYCPPRGIPTNNDYCNQPPPGHGMWMEYVYHPEEMSSTYSVPPPADLKEEGGHCSWHSCRPVRRSIPEAENLMGNQTTTARQSYIPQPRQEGRRDQSTITDDQPQQVLVLESLKTICEALGQAIVAAAMASVQAANTKLFYSTADSTPNHGNETEEEEVNEHSFLKADFMSKIELLGDTLSSTRREPLRPSTTQPIVYPKTPIESRLLSPKLSDGSTISTKTENIRPSTRQSTVHQNTPIESSLLGPKLSDRNTISTTKRTHIRPSTQQSIVYSNAPIESRLLSPNLSDRSTISTKTEHIRPSNRQSTVHQNTPIESSLQGPNPSDRNTLSTTKREPTRYSTRQSIPYSKKTIESPLLSPKLSDRNTISTTKREPIRYSTRQSIVYPKSTTESPLLSPKLSDRNTISTTKRAHIRPSVQQEPELSDRNTLSITKTEHIRPSTRQSIVYPKTLIESSLLVPKRNTLRTSKSEPILPSAQQSIVYPKMPFESSFLIPIPSDRMPSGSLSDVYTESSHIIQHRPNSVTGICPKVNQTRDGVKVQQGTAIRRRYPTEELPPVKRKNISGPTSPNGSMPVTKELEAKDLPPDATVVTLPPDPDLASYSQTDDPSLSNNI